MTSLAGLAEPWGGTSHLLDLDGPVHWVDFGGVRAGTPIVLVHGLGGSHLNWVRVAPALSEHATVHALDLPGFGLSVAGSRTTSVQANAALLDRFLREVVGAPVVLIGNSMGAMISLLEADAHPEMVAGVVLLDPSLPVPAHAPDVQVVSQFLLYSIPLVGERLIAMGRRRMSDRELVERVVNLCFAHPERASRAVMDAGTALLQERRTMPSQDAAFLQAARSLMRVLAQPRRYEALMRGLDLPVLLLHGERDRLVPVAAARKAAADNPRWTTVILPDVGHTPQLEVPDLVIDHVVDWLAYVEAALN